jgi:hypothetical protein
MRRIDGTFPPPEVLKALRASARGRPYTRRRLTGAQLNTLPLSRIVEIGTADDIDAAWQKRCRFRSRPGLRTLLVLAASEEKRAGKDVRSIVASLRQIEEDRARIVAKARRPWAEEIEVKEEGRVLVRRGRLVLSLQPEELGPDDEVIPDDDPYFRKKGRLRVVVEAWRDNRPRAQPTDGRCREGPLARCLVRGCSDGRILRSA